MGSGRRAPVLAVALVALGLVAASASSSLVPASADAEPARAAAAEPPTIRSGDDEHLDGDEPPPASPPVDLAAGRNDIERSSPWAGLWGPEIEPLASYEPQRLCLPGARPAVAAFAALLERAHPEGRDLGIARRCDIGSRSEHKEGRAYDWGVRVDEPAERRAAEQLVAWLLATDEHGNDFAMARRLGIMYVIWDGHIWSSSAARDGWRVYSGPSPHTDHVHLSFSWAGATGATSFWDATGIGPWLFDDIPLDRLPRTWYLGGSGFRAELGATPGALTPWTAAGEQQRDSGAVEGAARGEGDDAGGGTDGDAPVPVAEEPSPAPAPVPEPALPTEEPALPTEEVAPLPTLAPPPLPLEPTTTTTLTVPLVDDTTDAVVDAVQDAGDDLLGG